MLRAVSSASASGEAVLKTLGPAVSGVTSSEAIVLQAQLAPGQWQVNGSIRIEYSGAKSGTTDIGQISVRVGTAGTTADTAITGLSNFAVMSAGDQSFGGFFDVKLISTTSAQRIGGATTASSSFSGVAAAPSAATVITDASANSLFVSLSIRSAGATDTVSINHGRILLIAP